MEAQGHVHSDHGACVVETRQNQKKNIEADTAWNVEFENANVIIRREFTYTY